MEQLKKPPILIGAIVVAFLVLGSTIWHYAGPTSDGLPARALTAEEKANKEWREAKMRETGGDFAKLNAEDQRRLLALDGPQAPFNFRQMANNLPPKP